MSGFLQSMLCHAGALTLASNFDSPRSLATRLPCMPTSRVPSSIHRQSASAMYLQLVQRQ